MPDENPVATAIAEPEAPPSVLPSEAQDQLEQAAETPPEGETPAADSGAETPAEAPDVENELWSIVDDLIKEHPERFPEPPQQEQPDIEIERLSFEREQAQTRAVGLYQQELNQAEVKAAPAFQRLAQHAQELIEGKAEALSPDVVKELVGSVRTVQNDARLLGEAYADFQNEEYILEALQSHASFKLVGAEDRKKLAEFSGTRKDAIAAHIHAQLNAALQKGAPEEAKRQAQKDAEEKVKMAERLEKLSFLKNKNGKGMPEPTANTAGGYRTKMEARTLHVTGKITNAEMKRINADPAIPE